MSANIVSTGKTTAINSSAIAVTSFTINSGTNIALFAICCGNYHFEATPTATWNPGASQSMTLIVTDNQASWGSCAAFVLVNPTAGTGTITVSNLPGANDDDFVLYVFVVENVNQSSPTADAGGDTAGYETSKTLTIANMTANDLAVAAICADTVLPEVPATTVTIITGNNIGADSTDYTGVNTYTDAGAAYNTGTGNVSIVFGKNSPTFQYDGGALKFRIVGISSAASSLIPRSPTSFSHLLVR